jgi:hypothetical protein
MTIEEATDLILGESITSDESGEASLCALLRMGEDPGSERIQDLIRAMRIAYEWSQGSDVIDRRLAGALWTLGETVITHVDSWALGNKIWRTGFETEVLRLRSAIDAVFMGQWPGAEMIGPAEFVAQWNELSEHYEPAGDFDLLSVDPAALEGMEIPAYAKQFLAEAGLPKKAAPGLTFSETGDGLPRLWEVYSPGEWTDEEMEPIANYRVIGSAADDRAICIDEAEGGRVVLLNPEDGFAAREFVNSSIPQLASCLLIYQYAWDEAGELLDRQRNQRRSDWGTTKDEFTQETMAKLAQVDSPCCREGSPWWRELNDFWGNVEAQEAIDQEVADVSDEAEETDKPGKSWWKFGR